MKYRFSVILCAIILVQLLLLLHIYPLKSLNAANATPLEIFQAVMCEDVLANAPRNPTIVFSIAQKKAFCFSSFDPVTKKSVIFHNWFHRDVPSAKIRLVLNPPRWSTFSSIQLRKTDIGPWRVEITDEKGGILGVLRFSVTD